MKIVLLGKEYKPHDIGDIYGDVEEAISGNENPLEGKVRITVEWCSPDDCDCTGFQHSINCPHHEMCF